MEPIASVFEITDTSVPYYKKLVKNNPFKVLRKPSVMLTICAMKAAHDKGLLREPGVYRIVVHRSMRYEVYRFEK